jgi:hypothetical protein
LAAAETDPSGCDRLAERVDPGVDLVLAQVHDQHGARCGHREHVDHVGEVGEWAVADRGKGDLQREPGIVIS